MKTKRNLGVTLTLAGLLLSGMASYVSGTVIDSLPFVDNFDNGVIANSDDVVGAWPVSRQNIGSGLFTESGGYLNMNITAQNEFRYITTDLTDAFDFYSSAKTFTFADVTYATNGTSGNFLNVEFYSAGNSTASWLWLRFCSDGTVTFIQRINSTNTNLNTGTWSGTLTEFSVTFDGQDYSITWTSTDGGTQTISGQSTITVSDWGTGGTALSIQGQTTSGATNATVVSIGSVTVIPEPSTMSMLGMGVAVLGVFLFRRRQAE